MKWIDRLKAKIIHALGGLTRAEAMFPAPAEYVMEHDAVVYERRDEKNNDLQLSATFRFLQPHEKELKI